MKTENSGVLWMGALALLLSACGGGANGTAAGSANGTSGSAASSSGTAGNGGSTTDSSSTAGGTSGSNGTASSTNGSSGATNGSSTSSSGSSTSGGAITSFATPQEFFNAKVEPNMGFCRSCHVPGGTADTDKGRRMMLSSNSAEDYDKLQTSWTTLGKGVETNRILLKASNTDPESHTGGSPWPKDSTQYNDAKILLSCWDNPAGCAALLASAGGGTVPPPPPLLGDLGATGGRFYLAEFCEGKTDGAVLPPDPRQLLSLSSGNLNNKNYSVYYNSPFGNPLTDTLFKNQARQNALLVAKGEKPIYSAKRLPKTCGEYRARQAHGLDYIQSNPITGGIATVGTIIKLAKYLGYEVPSDPKAASAMLAEVAYKRYGYPASLRRNPGPMPGEDPNLTDGGSLQLPIMLAQEKDPDTGKWTGKLGVTCFGCHIAEIGSGEIVSPTAKLAGHPEAYGGSPDGTWLGLNGSNVDVGLFVNDVMMAFLDAPLSPDAPNLMFNFPGAMANHTRGSQNADGSIIQQFEVRNPESYDYYNDLLKPTPLGRLIPSPPANGDQDHPSWWWTHNKTQYLWTGALSSSNQRSDFFPSMVNPNDGHWNKRREGDYQDLDLWLNSMEAPAYPDGYCSNADGTPAAGDKPHCINRPLAEQGAILFHSKNLWAGDGNADIPKPDGGNGACAGCHGAYSPRYINQPGFLPDPRLGGFAGYTVPAATIRTDPFQIVPNYNVNPVTSGMAAMPGYGGAAGGLPVGIWITYSDAMEGWVSPEEYYAQGFPKGMNPPVSTAGSPPGAIGSGVLGYVAQPLHGVWASGPYLHNGSVPTVWDVLKPSDRPDVWLRQQVPESEAGRAGERAFDHKLARAYDYDKLGWKYERLACGAGPMGVPYLDCTLPASELPLYQALALGAAVPNWWVPPTGANAANDRAIFNTHGAFKYNGGHDFTKVLTDQERRALIEYLKTL